MGYVWTVGFWITWACLKATDKEASLEICLNENSRNLWEDRQFLCTHLEYSHLNNN